MHRLHDEYAPQPVRYAWLISAGLHAAILVLAAIVWQRTPAQAIVEGDRRGAIALALSPPQASPAEYLTFDVQRSATVANNNDGEDHRALPDPNDVHQQSTLPTSLALPLPGQFAPTDIQVNAPRTATATSTKLPASTDYSEFLAAEAARIQSDMPRGEPAEVSLFGGPASIGRSFVFVIDRSKSMGGNGLNALRPAADELARALAHLEPVHRFTLIAYHHENTYLDGPELIEATRENQQRVVPFLQGLAAFGQTEHELGLLGALRLKPDVIYLFTDGGDPHLTQPHLRSIHRIAAEQNTTIHCVQFGFGPLKDSNNFLVQLASANMGGYTYVDLSGQ